jgi:hypothetical protein
LNSDFLTTIAATVMVKPNPPPAIWTSPALILENQEDPHSDLVQSLQAGRYFVPVREPGISEVRVCQFHSMDSAWKPLALGADRLFLLKTANPNFAAPFALALLIFALVGTSQTGFVERGASTTVDSAGR